MHKQGTTTMAAIEDMEIEMMNEVMRDEATVSRAQTRIRAEHPNFRHWWKDEDVTKDEGGARET